MGEIAEAFRSGGMWMYLILAIGMTALPWSAIAVIASLFVKKRMAILFFGGSAAALGILAIGIGLVGYGIGLSNVQDALSVASPESHPRLEEIGTRAALYPLKFGGAVAVIPCLVGAILVALGLRRPKDA